MKLIFRMISRSVSGLLAMIAAQTLAKSFKDKIGTPAPDFLPGPTNITYNKGELAVLQCSVFNLGTRTVVWRKLDNSFPLTSGTQTIVADDRMHVGHVQARNQWDLMIKNVQLTDEGIYECQVASTDRSFRRLVVLTVLDLKDAVPDIKIIGPQYIEWDESFVLQCNATGEDHAPDEMDWFKDGHKINSDKRKRIKIAKQYSISSRSFSSTLQIDRASMDDSGIYVCRSSNNQITSIKLHVLNAETFNRKRGTLDNDSDAVEGAYSSVSAVSDSITLDVLTAVMSCVVLFAT